MTPACQGPRDRRGQRHGKKLAARPHRVDNPEESTVSPQSFFCPGHMLFSFSVCSLLNFFQPISPMQNHKKKYIYIYIYIYTPGIWQEKEGKMAARKNGSKSELQSKAHLVSIIQTHKTGVSLGGWPPGMGFSFYEFCHVKSCGMQDSSPTKDQTRASTMKVDPNH